MAEGDPVVLARRATGFHPFQWTGQEPAELNDED